MSVVDTAVGNSRAPLDAAASAADPLASRYARAFYEYVDERGALPEVMGEVRALLALIGESAALRAFLSDRTLDVRQSTEGLEAVLAAQGFGDALRRFAGVVAANRRLVRLADFLAAVLAFDASRRGELVVEVRSAQTLTPAQRATLQARLAEAGYARVSIAEYVAPELIGGLVVRIGASLFDTSIRGRLSRIQNVMKGAA